MKKLEEVSMGEMEGNVLAAVRILERRVRMGKSWTDGITKSISICCQKYLTGSASEKFVTSSIIRR